MSLPTFLPGALILARGTIRDYDALSPFHYLADRPATIASIFVVRYRQPHADFRDPGRPVAVGVLSWPAPSCAGRERFLHRKRFSRRQNLRFANRHIRTISRIIVHPQFRSLGLSKCLVRCLCDHCHTRYIEALAIMGRAVPFFKSAGMHEVRTGPSDRPVYYILDRGK